MRPMVVVALSPALKVESNKLQFSHNKCHGAKNEELRPLDLIRFHLLSKNFGRII